MKRLIANQNGQNDHDDHDDHDDQNNQEVYINIVDTYFMRHAKYGWNEGKDWIALKLLDIFNNSLDVYQTELKKLATEITLDIMESNEIKNINIDKNTDIKQLIFIEVLDRLNDIDEYLLSNEYDFAAGNDDNDDDYYYYDDDDDNDWYDD